MRNVQFEVDLEMALVTLASPADPELSQARTEKTAPPSVFQIGNDAKDDRTLDLRTNRIGIDNGTAIDRADDTANANRSVLRHLDFSNLCHIGPKDVLEGHASANSHG